LHLFCRNFDAHNNAYPTRPFISFFCLSQLF
jgi:hypothetical protein